LDERFVQLTLLLDQGEDTAGLCWQAGRQFQGLPPVLEYLSDPALVILGPPVPVL